MRWHDKTPWAKKRQDEAEKVAAIERLLQTYKAGGLSYGRLIAKIDEVVCETGAVVKVGNQHKPEIQS